METIDVHGLRIRYADSGAGPAVIAAHCSSASHREWSALAEALGDRHRILAPDLIGYGRSDRWPSQRVFEPIADAEALVRLAERAGEPVHLVGHSYGAAMALEAARLMGAGVTSLTLVEPVSFHLLRLAGCEPEWREISAVAQAVVAAAAASRMRKAAAAYMGFWIGRLRWLLMPRWLRTGILATVEKVALEFDGMHRTGTRLADYSAIRVPTRLVVGNRTRRPARKVAEVLCRLLPRTDMSVILGAGHMSPFTHRDTVAQLIVEHVDNIEAARSDGRNERAELDSDSAAALTNG